MPIVPLRFMFHYQIPHEMTPALASIGPQTADESRHRTPPSLDPLLSTR
jgi:hypothetical protein